MQGLRTMLSLDNTSEDIFVKEALLLYNARMKNEESDQDTEKITDDSARSDAADDVTIEEGVDENGDAVSGANPAAAMKKLRERLAKAVEEKQQYLDGWQRAKADFANAKKRDDEAKKDLIKYANEELISELIPALDSFDMAMGNKEAWEKADKNWRVGVEYIYSQLLAALERSGLKQDNPIGKEFDPTKYEPIDTVKTDKKEYDGKILQVIQKGYTLNGKDVRAAKVKVGEFENK